jgi:signal transduction histidine kinase
MKIFVNKDIKQFFTAIFGCVITYFIIALGTLISSLSKKYLFMLSILMIVAIVAICLRYFIKQNKTIEQAVFQIKSYLSGNKNARIECMYEGEMYRLFYEINNLVSVLNAHAENEFRGKEFLKNTISDISHQLKTPIAALDIYNGLIQEESENLSDIKKLAVLSEKEIDRMEILVQNLLKITKFDAGTIILKKETENIAEIMNCVYEQFSFRAREEKKEIILSGEYDIFLLCDRSWFLEAISNIVKNALDHTTAGGNISIKWKQSANIVQIIVTDNGSGIHPDDLHHIFKRFYRSRFSKDTQGIGLGLPLAKTIIEATGGNIELDSRLGMGTSFYINFLITTKL